MFTPLQQKLKTGAYATGAEFAKDVNQIWTNAIFYNTPVRRTRAFDSLNLCHAQMTVVYQFACKMQDRFAHMFTNAFKPSEQSQYDDALRIVNTAPNLQSISFAPLARLNLPPSDQHDIIHQDLFLLSNAPRWRQLTRFNGGDFGYPAEPLRSSIAGACFKHLRDLQIAICRPITAADVQDLLLSAAMLEHAQIMLFELNLPNSKVRMCTTNSRLLITQHFRKHPRIDPATQSLYTVYSTWKPCILPSRMMASSLHSPSHL